MPLTEYYVELYPNTDDGEGPELQGMTLYCHLCKIEGGALVFYNKAGDATGAYGPREWATMTNMIEEAHSKRPVLGTRPVTEEASAP